MKVIVMVKATKESEAGEMPGQELLAAMGNFNEELVKAGIMLYRCCRAATSAIRRCSCSRSSGVNSAPKSSSSNT